MVAGWDHLGLTLALAGGDTRVKEALVKVGLKSLGKPPIRLSRSGEECVVGIVCPALDFPQATPVSTTGFCPVGHYPELWAQRPVSWGRGYSPQGTGLTLPARGQVPLSALTHRD